MGLRSECFDVELKVADHPRAAAALNYPTHFLTAFKRSASVGQLPRKQDAAIGGTYHIDIDRTLTSFRVVRSDLMAARRAAAATAR